MEPVKFYFDIRDIFRSPRLALSGKKIWIFLKANLFGFVVYWLASYLALVLAGINFSDAINIYGLYPYIYSAENTGFIPIAIYWIGIVMWLISIFYACTAVSRLTYRQLKGDDFYTVADTRDFVKNHKYPVILSWVSILMIAVFFSLGAVFFALIGKIPFIGEILFALLYLIFFFGAVFTVYTLVVFFTSFLYSPAIVATMEEDTMGTVFQSYSITWSQPWRLVLYNLVLMPLMLIGVAMFKWFLLSGYKLINIIFGADLLMGAKLQNIVGWATNVTKPDMSFCMITQSTIALGETAGIKTLPSLPEGLSLSGSEYIAGTILAIMFFILLISVISYGLSILSVGETIIFIIFKKKSTNEDLLLRNDADDLAEEKFDQNATEISSDNIASSAE